MLSKRILPYKELIFTCWIRRATNRMLGMDKRPSFTIKDDYLRSSGTSSEAGVDATEAQLRDAADDECRNGDADEEDESDQPRLWHMDALVVELRPVAVGVEERVLRMEECVA